MTDEDMMTENQLDPDYGIAFDALHAMAEELKDNGLDKAATWAVIWSAYQDLSAADLVIGTDAYRDHIEGQMASLLDDAIEFPAATSH